jgi:hypothetical protein
MSQMELKQKFVLEVDGKTLTFDTKKEAQDFLRRPAIKAALANVTGGDASLSDWLIANQDSIEAAYDAGSIRRVTKVERNKLRKALDFILESHANVTKDKDGNITSVSNVDSKAAFVIDNREALLESFRWPSVQRMKPEEKELATRNTLANLTDNDEKLVAWILANKDAILEAYQAGKEKRAVNPAAAEALAAYRAKKAAEKAAAEAGEAGEDAAE